MSDKQFINDLIEFSTLSMDWCSKESAKSSKQIGDIMSFVVQDAKRISSMSEDTLDIVKDAKKDIDDLVSQGKSSELIVNLQKLCDEQVDIRSLIHPVVVALQFQDRICQNMDNQIKMLKLWHEKRAEVVDAGELSEEKLQEFGKALLDCTSMHEEREIIHTHIVNLPQDSDSRKNVQLF
jgi:hypothetical protein